MKFSCLKWTLLLVLAAAKDGQTFKNYEGYKVFQTKTLDTEDVAKLVPLTEMHDFWARPRPGFKAEIMVAPEEVAELLNILGDLKLTPNLITDDVSKLVLKEREDVEKIIMENEGKAPNWNAFMTLDEIDNYVQRVAVDFPNICTLSEIGSSLEGRPLRVLKFSTGPAGKPAIFINSAMHAREWIGPPVALFAINQLTEFFDQNAQLLDAIDFYIMPMVNPDGYLFSWQEDRFWRKTRNLNGGSECQGVDANRNFDFLWQAGNDTCSQTYPGTFATSEMEIKSLQDFLEQQPEITFYVDLHSYGQSMIFPWASSNEQTPMFSELMRVGGAAADALRTVRGTNYTVHTVTNGGTDFLFGVSVDWVHGVLGVPFAYAVELPKGGTGGFDIPPEEILPVATETWEAIKIYAQNVPAARERFF